MLKRLGKTYLKMKMMTATLHCTWLVLMRGSMLQKHSYWLELTLSIGTGAWERGLENESVRLKQKLENDRIKM